MNTSLKLTPAQQLGKMIREARPKGVSQEGLAEVVGTKQPVISRYERGAAIPSSKHLSVLIHQLNLDAERVYGLIRRHYDDAGRAGAA